MKEAINLSLPSKPEYVSIARLTASFIANQMGFDMEIIEDIKLAVGEACNNAIIHSGSEETYKIEFLNLTNELKIEIRDHGKGFSMDNYKKPNADDLQEIGRASCRERV